MTVVAESDLVSDDIARLMRKRSLATRLQESMPRLTPDEVGRYLPEFKTETFTAGTEVIRQGDAPENFYILIKGQVDVSVDFGATWVKANLSAPPNSHAWQRFRARVSLPSHGYYEVWARATDSKGTSQPFAVAWNPKGYLNNSLHRIALRVSA